jgi:hypothetical protein
VGSSTRIASVALRTPAVWAVLPVVVGLDVMIALNRGAGWRGELGSLFESLAPAVMLTAPFVAALGAWLARQDRALDRYGLLRSCAQGRRHVLVRIATAAGLTTAVHLLMLTTFGAVSLLTAQVGGWPIGALLVQVAAFPAFTSLGYLIGWYVDHLVGPLLAAALALLAAYTDYGSTRWPLGFISDGGTGSFVGRHPDALAVLGRLGFCTAVTALAALGAGWSFAPARGRWVTVATAAGLLGLAVHAIQTHPTIWVERVPPVVADDCRGSAPRVCVVPDYAGLAGRTARIADRTGALLRAAGARQLPETFTGWIPSFRQPANYIAVFDPETAAQPARSLDIVRDVIAPKGCPQWYSGVDLDREGAAEQIVLTWLVGQDPALAGGRPVPHDGADVAAFLRLSPAAQRARVAALATALATCDFTALPLTGAPR